MPVPPELDPESDPELAPELAPEFIAADWPSPPGIIGLCTTRVGGVSSSPYNGLNLATHVGDVGEDVATNRTLLAQSLDLQNPVAWLNQVHGVSVVRAGRLAHGADADAVWTDQAGVPCAVLTADCLPVLLCSDSGNCVAAAHAGWRGLAAGVLEATVAAMPEPGERLLAWMGPAIGPAVFEVGVEVREVFSAGLDRAASEAVGSCFIPSPSRPGHYHADLYGLARLRLAACGVTRIYGGGECTYADSGRFFSYRREARTGRMASLVLIRPPA